MSEKRNNRLKTYAISDRNALISEDLFSFACRAIDSSINMLQIREKDLCDKDLYELTSKIVEYRGASSSKILINDRLDVAIAAQADGVHLGNHSEDARIVRNFAPEHFIIGVSTHSLEEALSAEENGADFITFGPVFFTQSKAKYGDPVGIDALIEVCRKISLPVFPLGGINMSNIAQLSGITIAGVAAISLFQNADDLDSTLNTVRNLADG